jgi:3-hydroxypropanoate dehydrogenase
MQKALLMRSKTHRHANLNPHINLSLRDNYMSQTSLSASEIFTEGRSFSHWLDKPVETAKLVELYNLLKFGPTGANSCPARFIFVTSPEAKAKLKPCLDEGNINKMMSAPVTVIIGMDLTFYEKLPYLFPHVDARSWFADKPNDVKRTIALRDSSLQGAYLILAARSLGLDCGPMGGFNREQVDAAFFAGTTIQSNFLCSLGYGDRQKLHERLPRLNFDEVCTIQ